MKSLEIPTQNNEDIEEFNPYLEKLWGDYGFEGNPPKADSLAESRLKDTCERYTKYAMGLDVRFTTQKEAIRHHQRQRQLHNEIAVMVVGQQRSGMEEELAQKISSFATEYVQGIRPFYPYL
ncbi:MAG: hypothetical protein UT65_C0003G0011 [Parcubacteria group bacterium GW2011_GWF2_39_8b]|uniref:Uncharacterized protein n=3 Tax=Candidatus Zambryskiibacteriota TaxID=1817925 RepID=A0A1G2T6Z1_9BACT|nr:MAG: hypothetical protein UT65_C0003G0011 [Parcubacteria group bacterium GW2011_GWF2_39_8b]KKR45146.1 MAG: hypothetical protein UT81_C0020G0007 [Parcubacteria group bacterium GW2011_GWA2_40_14]OHA92942.1 MAG: hypothetical protein A2W58_03655 [Candidatus Zambryskibacteria bacterium RIFCSPHIGHO2_02_38_10.5]OHA99573.1 MAG: hypothetical protein A3E32_02845 [Candidatus Zambryskibacteria bacterium RIFCSPHIGHO2_12_FULL_38_37]OHB08253.1 MAG: hypothetical protein A2W64_02970 [Candidatus Zambryskibact